MFPEIIRIIRNKKDKNEEDIRLLNLFEEELLKMKKPKLEKGRFNLINIKHHIKIFLLWIKRNASLLGRFSITFWSLIL